MKNLITTLLLAFTITLSAQQIDYNTDDGYIAEGYDVTEYFNNKAIEGKSNYVATHDNVKFKFASQANLEKFKSNPGKFTPKYGGYCSYALATKADKVDIDPETFEINDGKLYLFYNSWGTNTHKKWKAEGAAKLKPKADANWEKIKTKK
ncbi:YHS domain-containing (seleno)protein [uncultured Aquimarina sp.]|uniref:YHS domain-containing (seleno)protein n=1 Tax=uncultured Aquimarina sp. TaxID=575652 RepID=UPI0026112DE7|nr:YHS domain-containing (seleno)protein [uncultured Aquimarina sp.]